MGLGPGCGSTRFGRMMLGMVFLPLVAKGSDFWKPCRRDRRKPGASFSESYYSFEL